MAVLQLLQYAIHSVHEQMPPTIKAVFFDFMGTCLDWHSAIVDAFPPSLSASQKSQLALAWRQEFFDEISSRFKASLPPENIDDTHRRTLSRLLLDGRTSQQVRDAFSDASSDSTKGHDWRERAIQAWHSMRAWPEVPSALQALQHEHGLELFVLANGTTRLQLDLVRSSGLFSCFSLLFSSELLGLYKPSHECYQRAMQLVKTSPEECVMVAAHAYDLRAAKAVGMRTVYVRRWTDDVGEDFDQISKENDLFLPEDEGMKGIGRAIEAFSLQGR